MILRLVNYALSLSASETRTKNRIKTKQTIKPASFLIIFYLQKKKHHYENVNVFSVSLLALQTINILICKHYN